ncbi:DsbC family protein [Polaromonas sp. JS666]|uniref:DsbC family protein n=1 Tax=Polaromonas sp. (strain JS666 / ATCC BAA-500) TaxID=296591 RepID=UPI000887F0C1|nr:DsbC family protein [Polaromonas sp. JS666]SDM41823.1 thiol:disulfide interchange protein DsbG [Polaromonas sp. JS666]
MPKPLFSFFAAALTACTLLLAGCNDAPEASTPKTAAAAPVSVEAIAAEAKGFIAGSQMSKRTVYVFFDAQCPHCAVLWEAAKPLKSQAKFVWIPVGILNAASTSQGATLLAAGDPVAAMDEHEASMKAGRGGISAASSIDPQKDAVAKNTALMTRMGFSGIPSIVGTHAQTGAVVSQEGALPTAALAELLGLQVPAQ